MSELHVNAAFFHLQNNRSHLMVETICLALEDNKSHRDFWHNRHGTIDRCFTVFILQIVISSLVSQVFYTVLRPLKQPRFVCRTLAAIVLGRSMLGQYIPYMKKVFPAEERLLIETTASLGSVYFIFLYAVKTDFSVLKRMRKSCLVLGASSFFIPLSIINLVKLLLYRHLPSDVLAELATSPNLMITFLALSIGYLSDIVSTLEEVNLLTSELGQIAMSSGILNEMLGWGSALFLIFWFSKTRIIKLYVTLSIFGFLGFTLCVARPAILWITRTRQEGKPLKQIYMVLLFLSPLLSGGTTDALGLNFITGSLIIGLVIPDGLALGAAVSEKLEVFIQELFLPFVYLRVGLLMDTTQIWERKTIIYLVMIFTAYFAKLLAVGFGSVYLRLRARDVLLLSLMLNIRGPMQFIFLNRQLLSKNIDVPFFTALILCHMLLTAIVAPLLEIHCKDQMKNGTSKPTMRSLLNTPEIGEFRVLLCIHDEDDVNGIITLLQAINPTETSPLYAYMVHIIDLIGRGTPVLETISSPKKTNNTGYRIIEAFSNFSKHYSKKHITIQPFISIAPYKTMHVSICRMAQDKHVPFIIVPFHKNYVDKATRKIRKFNSSLQDYAPCTIGILVPGASYSNNFGCTLGLSQAYKNVAVLFFGGDDDREALSLVAWMTRNNPNVNVTVIRVIFAENIDREENEEELKINNNMFMEFQARNMDNRRVECNELRVNDMVEGLQAIQSLGNSYDLIIVGRRQGTVNSELLEEHLKLWTECMELGMIGDMLSSLDFCGGTVSVLVLQHHKMLDKEIS